MKKYNRLIAILLTVLMLVSLTVPAFAEEARPADGEGVQEGGTEAPVTESAQEDGSESAQEQESLPSENTEAGEEEQLTEPDDEEEPENEPMELMSGEECTVWVNYGLGYAKGFTSLSSALSDSSVTAGATLTLTGDIEISSRICFGSGTGNVAKKNITLTDDGTRRTVYFCNTETKSTYGRGIQVNSGYSFNIKGTATGGIVLCGKSMDGSTANKGNLIYLYAGKMVLENVSFTQYSKADGAICVKSGAENMTVGGCSFAGNSTADAADLYIEGNTDIVLTGTNTIPVLRSVTGKSLTVSGNPSASKIGLELPASRLEYGAQILTGDSAALSSAYKAFSISGLSKGLELLPSGKIGKFSEINPGTAHPAAGIAYRLSAATVSMGATNETSVLSVCADIGKISVDWSCLGAVNITRAYFVTADGEYGAESGQPSETDFMGFSLKGNWTAAAAQSFIRGLRLSVDTDGMTQTVKLGIFHAGPEGEVYFGGFRYGYSSEPVAQYTARTRAGENGVRLAAVRDGLSSVLLKGAFGKTGWLGGQLMSDNWYWIDENGIGTRISQSSSASQGYGGLYTGWAEGEPTSGNGIVLNSDGRWKARPDVEAYGYYYETEDVNCVTVSTKVSAAAEEKQLALTSMSLSMDESLRINFFITLPDNFADDENAYIVAKNGSSSLRYTVKDLLSAGNTSAHTAAYMLSVPVKASELNGEVLLQFFSSDGGCVGVIGRYENGNSLYNVRWYAENVILKNAKGSGDSYNAVYSAELVNLVKALLNYGAAAQQQFGTAGEPADKGYEDSSPLTEPSALTDSAVASYTGKYYIEIVAGSETLLRIRPDTESSFTASMAGRSLEVKQDSRGYYVDLPVAVDELTKIYSVEFAGGFQGSLSVNAIGVIKAVLENAESSSAAKNTADKLYKLAMRAGEYAGVYVPSASCTEAVLSTAYAYLAKALYTQYDQKKLSETGYCFSGETNSRRQITASPQSATEQSEVYLDCSSFVFNVYREVFGEEKTLAALGLTDTDDVQTVKMIKCKEKSLVNTYDTSDTGSIDLLLKDLQPGDLIVKYRNSKPNVSAHGHVVLWTGNGYIHSTGSSYDYDNGKDKLESNGAVLYVPAAELRADWYEGFDTLVLLRPLNMLSAEDTSAEGSARRQLGALAMSKLAYCGEQALYSGQSVTPGATVRYVLRLENPVLTGSMTTTRTFTVTDNLPASGVAFAGFAGSIAGKRTGNTLSWTVSLAPGESVELVYTVTVTATAVGTIPSSDGTVLSVEAGEKAQAVSFCGNAISVEKAAADDRSAVTAKAAKLSGTCSSAIDTLNSLYSGIGSLGETENEWAEDIFTVKKAYSYVNASLKGLGKYLVSNLAGGRTVLSSSGSFNGVNRARNVALRNILPGDVIAVCTVDPSTTDTEAVLSSAFYIYLGGDDMLRIATGEEYSSCSASAVLQSLLARDCFAVLRPCGR